MQLNDSCTYLTGLGELEFDVLEGQWFAFGLKDSDFVFLGEVRRHVR